MTTMGCGCCTSFAALGLLWSTGPVGVLALVFFLGRSVLGFCLAASIRRLSRTGGCDVFGTALAIVGVAAPSSIPLCRLFVPVSLPVATSILAAPVLVATFAPAAAALPTMTGVIDKLVEEIATFLLALLALEELSAIFCGATTGAQNVTINRETVNCLYCNTRILRAFKHQVSTVQGRTIAVTRDLCPCWCFADSHRCKLAILTKEFRASQDLDLCYVDREANNMDNVALHYTDLAEVAAAPPASSLL
mmetsp:Transcript_60702/g.120256  ORF Transcript_60702/g.120256 Transcript_60702/m.120256 type:complete len:249 (-) Transcript_60702:429-1175(-)